MASDLPVAVRIHQYLRTLSAHLRERASAMLLAEARDEIERLRLTDEERQAIAWVCGDVADITGPTEDTLRALLQRTA